jgi:hypothetical protein
VAVQTSPVPALTRRVHLFAHTSDRAGLEQLFGEILGLGPPLQLEPHGYAEAVDVYRFPNGASISIEFTLPQPRNNDDRLGAWLELLVDDPETVQRNVLDAGFPRVPFIGNEYFYFRAPGGQVFRVLGHGEA